MKKIFVLFLIFLLNILSFSNEKITNFDVDFKVNNRGEVVIKVLDDNKPRNITFHHPIGGNKNVKSAKFGNAYYQCKNPLKKWHSAEQSIELILAKIR